MDYVQIEAALVDLQNQIFAIVAGQTVPNPGPEITQALADTGVPGAQQELALANTLPPPAVFSAEVAAAAAAESLAPATSFSAVGAE
jgi:hypothetical protein